MYQYKECTVYVIEASTLTFEGIYIWFVCFLTSWSPILQQQSNTFTKASQFWIQRIWSLPLPCILAEYFMCLHSPLFIFPSLYDSLSCSLHCSIRLSPHTRSVVCVKALVLSAPGIALMESRSQERLGEGSGVGVNGWVDYLLLQPY